MQKDSPKRLCDIAACPFRILPEKKEKQEHAMIRPCLIIQVFSACTIAVFHASSFLAYAIVYAGLVLGMRSTHRCPAAPDFMNSACAVPPLHSTV